MRVSSIENIFYGGFLVFTYDNGQETERLVSVDFSTAKVVSETQEALDHYNASRVDDGLVVSVDVRYKILGEIDRFRIKAGRKTPECTQYGLRLS